MESPEDTHIRLLNLGSLLKAKMAFVEHEQEQITGLKEEIREILKDNDIKKFDDEKHNLHIKVTYGFAFDYGLFKMNNPELVKRFFTTMTETKTKDVFDKKQLNKECPEEYRKCLVELTPRLTIR